MALLPKVELQIFSEKVSVFSRSTRECGSFRAIRYGLFGGGVGGDGGDGQGQEETGGGAGIGGVDVAEGEVELRRSVAATYLKKTIRRECGGKLGPYVMQFLKKGSAEISLIKIDALFVGLCVGKLEEVYTSLHPVARHLSYGGYHRNNHPRIANLITIGAVKP